MRGVVLAGEGLVLPRQIQVALMGAASRHLSSYSRRERAASRQKRLLQKLFP